MGSFKKSIGTCTTNTDIALDVDHIRVRVHVEDLFVQRVCIEKNTTTKKQWSCHLRFVLKAVGTVDINNNNT